MNNQQKINFTLFEIGSFLHQKQFVTVFWYRYYMTNCCKIIIKSTIVFNIKYDEVLQYLMDLIFNGFGVQILVSTTGFQTTDFSLYKVF